MKTEHPRKTLKTALNLRDIERQRAMGTASHLPARRAFCAYDKPAREGYAPECEPTRDDTTGTRPRQ